MSGSSWDLVAPVLRQRGHQVEAIDLHRGSLAADTRHAQEVTDSFAGSVVACGHSYGGMVVTGLALPPGSQLAYVASFMPAEDESSGVLTGQWPAEGHKVMSLEETATSCSGERSWTPSAGAVPRRSRPPPSTYVVCRQDRAVHPDLQREMSKRATHVLEWDSSHSPNVAHPEKVVDLLDRLARV